MRRTLFEKLLVRHMVGELCQRNGGGEHCESSEKREANVGRRAHRQRVDLSVNSEGNGLVDPLGHTSRSSECGRWEEKKQEDKQKRKYE